MTKAQAAKLTLKLWDRYPHARRGETTLQSYQLDIEDLPFEETLHALKSIIRTQERDFPPPVATIRRVVLERIAGKGRTGEEAWAIAVEGIRRFGADREPKWKDQLIPRVLAMWGGWAAFCRSPDSDTMADRMRFAKLYDELANRARLERQAAPGLLPTGESAPKTLRAGTQTDAQAVSDLAGGLGRKMASGGSQ